MFIIQQMGVQYKINGICSKMVFTVKNTHRVYLTKWVTGKFT